MGNDEKNSWVEAFASERKTWYEGQVGPPYPKWCLIKRLVGKKIEGVPVQSWEWMAIKLTNRVSSRTSLFRVPVIAPLADWSCKLPIELLVASESLGLSSKSRTAATGAWASQSPSFHLPAFLWRPSLVFSNSNVFCDIGLWSAIKYSKLVFFSLDSAFHIFWLFNFGGCDPNMINAFLVFNGQGQPRLTKFYTQLVCNNLFVCLQDTNQKCTG